MDTDFARNRYVLAVGAIVLVIMLFLSVNVFSTAVFRSVRVDLTENKLFTLSPGTVEVLRSIDEPITLRLYLSQQIRQGNPLYARYTARVRELLEHYERLADGKIVLRIFEPEPFSVEEDRALSFGLQGVPYDASGELVYFGLAGTNSTDDQDIVSFFQPERENFLEYDLTRLIYNLANPKKKVVAVLTSLPMLRDPVKRNRPWVVKDQMDRFFEVRELKTDSLKIDDDVDVILLAQPAARGDTTLYAIDQFIMRGGRALIFVDPHVESEAGRRPQGMATARTHGMQKLFAAWGIEFDDTKVVGDRLSAQRVNAPIGDRTVIADYLPWLALRPARFDTDDVVTAQISVLNMESAGAFQTAKDATVRLVPLITTSEQSMLIDRDKVAILPNPLELMNQFKPSGEAYVLAARLEGQLKSAFPDGPPKPEEAGAKANQPAAADSTKEAEAEPALPKHLSQSEGPLKVILVSDADILADQSWVRGQDLMGQELAVPIANNGHFVLNALDNLTGSSAVIGLRSRGLSVRPFNYVEKIRREAELKFRSKEEQLQQNLRELEQKISDIETDEKSGSVILSRDQRQAIEDFRTEMIDTRADLRNVQHELRKDIETLGTWIKAINIGAVPLLIGIIAIIIAIVRRVRLRRRFEISRL